MKTGRPTDERQSKCNFVAVSSKDANRAATSCDLASIGREWVTTERDHGVADLRVRAFSEQISIYFKSLGISADVKVL